MRSSFERAYPRKIPDLIAFFLPFALLSGLALGGGGYDLFARHLSGILAWILVALLLIGPWPERVRPGRSLALVGGLILALALYSGLSSIWSSSVSASLAEFERAIAYLGYFTASYLTMRTPKQREWFARGIAAGLGFIILLALGDRLNPAGETDTVAGFARLSYPLGYWNGNGICFAAALVLFTWLAATARRAPWRAVSIIFAMLGASALYLTYSRGGILVTTLAMLLLFFLSVRRLRLLATFTILVAATVPILLTINQYPTIAGNASGNPPIGEILVVIAVMAASVALAWVVFETVLRLAERRYPVTERALAISRDRRTLIGLATLIVGGLLLLSLAFGSNIWDQFTDSDVPAPVDANARFTELSGSWRYEFNKVSLDTFSDHPLLGSGAGTFPFEWASRRPVLVVTQDAHSFYLENLAELGIPGGLLSLALPLALAGLGILAWRRRLGLEAPMFLALTVAIFVSLAFDWFWKLGVTAALLMLLAAWIVSAEAVDPHRRPRRQPGPGSGTTARVRICGLLAAWAAIVVLAVPGLADYLNRTSADAVRAGQIEKAIDRSELASEIAPWSPEPHLQLATIAESRRQIALARREYNRAIELEPANWWAVLRRLQLNYDAGWIDMARADLERLREINPLYFGNLSIEAIRRMKS